MAWEDSPSLGCLAFLGIGLFVNAFGKAGEGIVTGLFFLQRLFEELCGFRLAEKLGPRN